MTRPPTHASSAPEEPSGFGSRPLEGAGPAWLPSLGRARTVEGVARVRELQRLQQELEALGAEPGLREARARSLLALLQDDQLEGLVGHRGWTARAMVTAALLNHGGPVALLLHPDDLQHLREVRGRARVGLGRGTLLGLLASLLVAWVGLIATLEPLPVTAPGPRLHPLQWGALLYVVALPPLLLLEVLRRHTVAATAECQRGGLERPHSLLNASSGGPGGPPRRRRRRQRLSPTRREENHGDESGEGEGD